MTLVVIAMLATPTSESRAGGSLQLSRWVTLEDADADADRTVLYREGEIFELYVEVSHNVAPGDKAIEILVLLDLGEEPRTSIWRGSTNLMGSEANGTLHLELRGVSSGLLSEDRNQQLKGLARPSRSHQLLARGIALGVSRLDMPGVEDETRQILLPPISQAEGPAFRWRYLPQSQLLSFFIPPVVITFDPSGHYALQVESGR